MRRKDREVTEKSELQAILDANVVCRLGLADEGQPYVLPLNFGYEWPEQGPLTIYFHCAKEGLKLDIIAKNDRACFEVDGGHQLLTAEKIGDYSFAYASIIGFGRARIIDDPGQKRRALQKLMEHQAGPGEYPLSEAAVNGVTVFCLVAEQVTGKRNLPK